MQSMAILSGNMRWGSAVPVCHRQARARAELVEHTQAVLVSILSGHKCRSGAVLFCHRQARARAELVEQPEPRLVPTFGGGVANASRCRDQHPWWQRRQRRHAARRRIDTQGLVQQVCTGAKSVRAKIFKVRAALPLALPRRRHAAWLGGLAAYVRQADSA
jgi:hypothetical protein